MGLGIWKTITSMIVTEFGVSVTASKSGTLEGVKSENQFWSFFLVSGEPDTHKTPNRTFQSNFFMAGEL